MFYLLININIYILLNVVWLCDCVEPVTSALYGVTAIAASVGIAAYNPIYCRYYECCANPWVTLKLPDLEDDINSNLFGQPFVQKLVPRILKAHMEKKNPKKALVMAFHGWTGCGKNHVSQMIVKHIFKLGEKSSFYHLYIGDRDFPHATLVDQYKNKLRKEVEAATKECGQSIFVFDEVDKMPPGVLDALKPYLDVYDQIEGVNYRKNIFIFLSNAGGENITATMLKFWAQGKDREDIQLKDIEPQISRMAFNEKGGLRRSELLKRDLIDVYVPFLPLERTHVRRCVEVAMEARGLRPDPSTVRKVLDELIYEPPGTDLYAASGCKKIEQKVDQFVD